MRPRGRRRGKTEQHSAAPRCFRRACDLPPRATLEHDLDAELGWLRAFKSHRTLRAHPLYPRVGPRIEAVLRGFEWDLALPRPPASPGPLRAVSWNIERGKRFDALTAAFERNRLLVDADLVLLNEVDIGMGRSENRNVPRELAARFGYAYVFANSHLVLSAGDAGERGHGRPNRKGLHGNALLSRYPVRRFGAVTLPEYRDKLGALEQRLGDKRALMAEIELPSGPLLVAAVHLDPFAPPRYRAAQMGLVLDALSEFEARGDLRGCPLLLGGDLNTLTYDLSTPLGLARGLAHRAFLVGLAGTIAHYMTPEVRFERPLFEVLARAGLEVEGYNDRSLGTLHFDANDPEVLEKAVAYVPMMVYEYLARRLDPWDRRVPMRLDWFAGRGLVPRSAWVVAQPPSRAAQAADHDPIVVEVDHPAPATPAAPSPDPGRRGRNLSA